MKLTIKEIADLAGVSVTTVSQILNNKGSRFSKETTVRVLEIVEKYHFKPDFFASNLINRHSKTIGMIVPNVTDFFFSKVIEGVETLLNELGYMILLCNSKHSLEKETEYVEELIHRSVDGVILATPHMLPKDHFFYQENEHYPPFILVDRGMNPRSGGKLIVEEFQGAFQAVSCLIENGHRHIAMLKEIDGYYRLTERLDAYKEALKNYQIPIRQEYIGTGELTLKGGYLAAKQVLKNPDITAIFCSNDEMAMGAYQAVAEAGKKIPDDISVIGFDGLEISDYLVPSLSTVSQPSFDIGYYAAQFLVEAIENSETKIPNKLFQTIFIKRNSMKNIDFPNKII